MRTRQLAAVLAFGTLAACASGGTSMQSISSIQDAAARDTYVQQLRASAGKPMEGTSGRYMAPFTSDEVTAEWVTKAMSVQTTGQIGSTVGQVAGDQLLSNIPFAGLFAGKASKALARSAALESIGGEKFLVETSDQSFDDLNDMASWMYAYYGEREDYGEIVKATVAIYPEFADAYAGYPLN